MIKRTIDVSKPSYLSLKNQQLLIDQEGKTVGNIPVEDLGILILEHPAITITQGVILACQKKYSFAKIVYLMTSNFLNLTN